MLAAVDRIAENERVLTRARATAETIAIPDDDELRVLLRKLLRLSSVRAPSSLKIRRRIASELAYVESMP